MSDFAGHPQEYVTNAMPSRRERIKSNLSEKGLLAAFLAPAVIVLIVGQLYPLLYSAYLAVINWSLAKSPTPQGFAGLHNFAVAFRDPVFVGSMRTTLIFAFSATAAEIILGFLLAYLTVGERLWLQISRTVLLMPMVIAPVAVGTMWRMLLNSRAGLISTTLASIGIPAPDWFAGPNSALMALVMIDVWEWTPFVMIIYVAAISSLPSAPIKAAAVDGASRWQIFRFITMPLLLPVTLLVVMFRLLDTLMVLDIVFTTTYGGPGFSTYTLSFWIYQQGLRYFNISYAAATSWLLLIGCMIVAIVLMRLRSYLSTRSSY